MKVYKTKWLDRFARREGIPDRRFQEAVDRAECGSIDADLGGGLIKQRVARAGSGRSGGYRTIVAYRANRRAVLLYAFAKSERDNIGEGELEDLRELGRRWMALSAGQIADQIHGGALLEVTND